MPGCSKIGKLLEMATAYFFLATTNITKYIHSLLSVCIAESQADPSKMRIHNMLDDIGEAMCVVCSL
ncbi:hypothetical protein BofuT4_uP048960.1 [Botrytis cinerea T4]|uniref:Uncharacterized protein n=1 Tax=Botryotinia fuckeliana (strain T4) TaxID=999810 RepID=G2XZJ1_BOTF4|nr:hypothetical protein BofuT4_uP048960.1 [Botrytis cinerea T4]